MRGRVEMRAPQGGSIVIVMQQLQMQERMGEIGSDHAIVGVTIVESHASTVQSVISSRDAAIAIQVLTD